MHTGEICFGVYVLFQNVSQKCHDNVSSDCVVWPQHTLVCLQVIEETKSSLVLTEQVVVWVPLIFEGQSSIADMVEILQPLEIRHCHTASIQVHVLQDETSQTHQTSGCLISTLCVCVRLSLIKNVLCIVFKIWFGKNSFLFSVNEMFWGGKNICVIEMCLKKHVKVSRRPQ